MSEAFRHVNFDAHNISACGQAQLIFCVITHVYRLSSVLSRFPDDVKLVKSAGMYNTWRGVYAQHYFWKERHLTSYMNVALDYWAGPIKGSRSTCNATLTSLSFQETTSPPVHPPPRSATTATTITSDADDATILDFSAFIPSVSLSSDITLSESAPGRTLAAKESVMSRFSGGPIQKPINAPSLTVIVLANEATVGPLRVALCTWLREVKPLAVASAPSSSPPLSVVIATDFLREKLLEGAPSKIPMADFTFVRVSLASNYLDSLREVAAAIAPTERSLQATALGLKKTVDSGALRRALGDFVLIVQPFTLVRPGRLVALLGARREAERDQMPDDGRGFVGGFITDAASDLSTMGLAPRPSSELGMVLSREAFAAVALGMSGAAGDVDPRGGNRYLAEPLCDLPSDFRSVDSGVSLIASCALFAAKALEPRFFFTDTASDKRRRLSLPSYLTDMSIDASGHPLFAAWQGSGDALSEDAAASFVTLGPLNPREMAFFADVVAVNEAFSTLPESSGKRPKSLKVPEPAASASVSHSSHGGGDLSSVLFAVLVRETDAMRTIVNILSTWASGGASAVLAVDESTFTYLLEDVETMADKGVWSSGNRSKMLTAIAEARKANPMKHIRNSMKNMMRFKFQPHFNAAAKGKAAKMKKDSSSSLMKPTRRRLFSNEGSMSTSHRVEESSHGTLVPLASAAVSMKACWREVLSSLPTAPVAGQGESSTALSTLSVHGAWLRMAFGFTNWRDGEGDDPTRTKRALLSMIGVLVALVGMLRGISTVCKRSESNNNILLTGRSQSISSLSQQQQQQHHRPQGSRKTRFFCALTVAFCTASITMGTTFRLRSSSRVDTSIPPFSGTAVDSADHRLTRGSMMSMDGELEDIERKSDSFDHIEELFEKCLERRGSFGAQLEETLGTEAFAVPPQVSAIADGYPTAERGRSRSWKESPRANTGPMHEPSSSSMPRKKFETGSLLSPLTPRQMDEVLAWGLGRSSAQRRTSPLTSSSTLMLPESHGKPHGFFASKNLVAPTLKSKMPIHRAVHLVGLDLPPRPQTTSSKFYTGNRLTKDKSWDMWLRRKVLRKYK